MGSYLGDFLKTNLYINTCPDEKELVIIVSTVFISVNNWSTKDKFPLTTAQQGKMETNEVSIPWSPRKDREERKAPLEMFIFRELE